MNINNANTESFYSVANTNVLDTQFNQSANHITSKKPLNKSYGSTSFVDASIDVGANRSVVHQVARKRDRNGNQIQVGSQIVGSSPGRKQIFDQEKRASQLHSPLSKNDSEAQRAFKKLKLNNSSKMLV